MAATTTSYVGLTLGYEDTEQTREYKFADVPQGALSSVESKIAAYNANVPVGDKAVFVSDEGDHMTSIVSAYFMTVTETPIIER